MVIEKNGNGVEECRVPMESKYPTKPTLNNQASIKSEFPQRQQVTSKSKFLF